MPLPTEALDLKLPTEVLGSNWRDPGPSFMDMVRVNQGKAGRIPGVKCEADTAQDADRRSMVFSVTADVVRPVRVCSGAYYPTRNG